MTPDAITAAAATAIDPITFEVIRHKLQAITEETQRALREALGDKAFRYYDRRVGQNWVRSGTGVKP